MSIHADTKALRAAALYTASRGWPVFLLGHSKRPVANCRDCRPGAHDPAGCGHLTCHGFYAATTDPERIAALIGAVPGGQLAVRTGTDSGLLVIDVDPGHGGGESLAGLVTEGLTPPTACVRTGSGGWHLYYRHPGGTVPSRPMPGRAGIDVKADGGYVVAPPSIHPRTGRPYEWLPGGRGVQEMPPPLVRACLPAPAATVTTPANPIQLRGAGGISHPGKLLAAHLAAVASAPEGHRRTTLYGAARGVARMVAAGSLTRADAETALTRAGRQAEQTDREIRAAIRGGFRDEGLAA